MKKKVRFAEPEEIERKSGASFSSPLSVYPPCSDTKYNKTQKFQKGRKSAFILSNLSPNLLKEMRPSPTRPRGSGWGRKREKHPDEILHELELKRRNLQQNKKRKRKRCKKEIPETPEDPTSSPVSPAPDSPRSTQSSPKSPLQKYLDLPSKTIEPTPTPNSPPHNSTLHLPLLLPPPLPPKVPVQAKHLPVPKCKIEEKWENPKPSEWLEHLRVQNQKYCYAENWENLSKENHVYEFHARVKSNQVSFTLYMLDQKIPSYIETKKYTQRWRTAEEDKNRFVWVIDFSCGIAKLPSREEQTIVTYRGFKNFFLAAR